MGGKIYAKREGNRQAPWYEAYLSNMADIPSDAVRMFEGFLKMQKKRFDDGNYLDLLSMGIASGFWKGVENRTQSMLDAPNAYNIANWLTIGLLDLGKGALIPDKPLSLEHWLDSLGFASALYGVAEVGRRTLITRKPASSDKLETVQNTSYREKIENIFPVNPDGLTMKIYDTKNGKIIKWFDSEGKAVYEWDEDLLNEPHYHVIGKDGNKRLTDFNGNTHFKPGDNIPGK